MLLDSLEPREVFRFFLELSDIPRGSGNEKAASDYVYAFAMKKGLEAYQDAANNVIIKKPGTRGYEDAPGVIIQGHLDIVCEKNGDVDHDFLTEGIKVIKDGGFLKAKGTTLGADNGVAVAMGMALLGSNDIPHPPLTVILTTGEETGMHGASALDPIYLQGAMMINLDSGGEGVFTVGCAGGVRALLTISYKTEEAPPGYSGMKIEISGLKGGHSGKDIDQGRANANKLLGRLLLALKRTQDVRIAAVNGGEKENAIPREAFARIAVPSGEKEAAISRLNDIAALFKSEYYITDPGVCVTVTEDPLMPQMMDKEDADAVIAALNLIPYGVRYMQQALPEFVETSMNLGVLRTECGKVTLYSSLRSSVSSKKRELLSILKLVAEVTGAEFTTNSDYPAWAYRPVSKLRDTFAKAYREMSGKEPEFLSIHAGLECGVILEKAKDLDIVALGPDAFDNHSPDERLDIASTGRIWELLKTVLAELK